MFYGAAGNKCVDKLRGQALEVTPCFVEFYGWPHVHVFWFSHLRSAPVRGVAGEWNDVTSWLGGERRHGDVHVQLWLHTVWLGGAAVFSWLIKWGSAHLLTYVQHL